MVPVKSRDAKSRLSGIVTRSQRDEFSRILLRGILRTVQRSSLIGSCIVVSSDPGALDLARRMGARPVKESRDRGVNSAVMKAIESRGGSGCFLVLPSDLPALSCHDIEGLLKLWRTGAELVIAPSRAFDGTNALLFSPASGLPLSYDDDSFWNHLAAAGRLGLRVAVCSRYGVMFDVDTPSDFRELAASVSRSAAAKYARRVSR